MANLLSAIRGLTPGRDGRRRPRQLRSCLAPRLGAAFLPLPVTRNGNTYTILVRALAFNARNRRGAVTFSLLRVTWQARPRSAGCYAAGHRETFARDLVRDVQSVT